MPPFTKTSTLSSDQSKRQVSPINYNTCMTVKLRHIWNISRKRSLSPDAFRACLSSAGYKSIGSFHSDNVDFLMSQSDQDYSVPTLPFDFVPYFNDECLSDNFFVPGDWTFVNHGAFGAALKCGHLLASKWRDYSESQPLRYFDRDLLPHLVYSTRQLAQFCHGDRAGFTLTQNSTFALNTIISGYTSQFKGQAKVVYFDSAYGSVKKMAKHYTSVNGHGLAIEIPILHDILNAFKCANDLDPSDRLFRLAMDKVKSLDIPRENTLLIMDQTTSNTAINFPIEKIATAAKREGMLVAVDGAHGLLAHELNLKALAKAGVDFYVSNCHKWFCSPRGAAFLYCGSASLRDTILRRPAIVSHGIDDGYHSRFIWDGCRDYSAQLTLPIVIQFWNQLGPQRVQTIMRTNLTNAIQLLAHKWYPEHNFGSDLEKITAAGVMIVPLSLHSPMALVRLPCKKPRVYTSTDAKVIQDFLFSRMIEAPIKCVEGSLYVRISSHVYNTLEHYDKLGNAIASCNLLI